MTMDALKCILSCIEVDGRSVTHAIIEDSEAKKTSQKIGAAPILKKITIDSIKSSDLLLLPDKGRLDSGKPVMSSLLATTSNTDQHRVCDGVLIRILPEKDGVTPLEIGYFDLKSGNTDKNNSTPSLNKKASRPVLASANTAKNADKYIVKNGDIVPAYRILS